MMKAQGSAPGRTIGLACLYLLAASVLCSAQAAALKTYVSDDGSFWFRYAAEWNVNQSSPGTFLLDGPSGEEMTVLLIRNVGETSPAEYARGMVARLRSENPDVRASLLNADAARADLRFVYTTGFQRVGGRGTVLKESSRAVCIVYSVDASRYNENRATQLISLIVSSSHGEAPTPTAQSLIGDWSADSLTGAETYTFLPGGKFRHALFGAGSLISGMTVDTGDFALRGDALMLHAGARTWQPAPSDRSSQPAVNEKRINETDRFKCYFEDAETLVLIAPGSGLRTSLYRLKKDGGK